MQTVEKKKRKEFLNLKNQIKVQVSAVQNHISLTC